MHRELTIIESSPLLYLSARAQVIGEAVEKKSNRFVERREKTNN